jgi:single-strand DNA-binding protein
MNKSMLTGRLSNDVESRKSPSGKPIATFTLAVSKKSKTNEAIFLPIVTWDSNAQSCATYLKKGSRVAFIGEINVRSYDDAEGIKRWVTEIVAETVEFMDKKPNEERVINKDEPHGIPVPSIEE